MKSEATTQKHPFHHQVWFCAAVYVCCVCVAWTKFLNYFAVFTMTYIRSLRVLWSLPKWSLISFSLSLHRASFFYPIKNSHLPLCLVDWDECRCAVKTWASSRHYFGSVCFSQWSHLKGFYGNNTSLWMRAKHLQCVYSCANWSVAAGDWFFLFAVVVFKSWEDAFLDTLKLFKKRASHWTSRF